MTSKTSTPSSSRPSRWPSCRVTWSSATWTPSVGRTTRPCRMSCVTTRRTVSTGMAKPMPTLPAILPAAGEKIAVFTPISCPRESSSGPPELPGLIAASVWMHPLIGRPPTPSTSRPSAETTPVVSVWSRPNGFPMASTVCPTLSESDEPTTIGGGSCTPGFASIFSTARSFSGSMPTTLASYAAGEPCVVTLSLSAWCCGPNAAAMT
mmetsp:Transcript_40207/g.99655  ORF Transcript_40207/g.99655 Transcript_40207/m.99655 type:complete len:208 (-) Transcript_40207:508-1131(-)